MLVLKSWNLIISEKTQRHSCPDFNYGFNNVRDWLSDEKDIF